MKPAACTHPYAPDGGRGTKYLRVVPGGTAGTPARRAARLRGHASRSRGLPPGAGAGLQGHLRGPGHAHPRRPGRGPRAAADHRGARRHPRLPDRGRAPAQQPRRPDHGAAAAGRLGPRPRSRCRRRGASRREQRDRPDRERRRSRSGRRVGQQVHARRPARSQPGAQATGPVTAVRPPAPDRWGPLRRGTQRPGPPGGHAPVHPGLGRSHAGAGPDGHRAPERLLPLTAS